MATLIPLATLTRDDVFTVIRDAMRGGLDSGLIADFVASVDWSYTGQKRPEIADVIGQIEGWASMYEDGELTQAEYVGHLLSLLPVPEQRQRLVVGGGPVRITLPAFHRRQAPSRPALSSQPPQTGSGAHPPESAESESDIVLAV